MDQKLLFLINREWTSPALDRVMTLLSSMPWWSVPLGIIAVAALVRGGFRARVFVPLAILTFLVNDMVIGASIKSAVGRLRPYQAEVWVRKLDAVQPPWRMFG